MRQMISMIHSRSPKARGVNLQSPQTHAHEMALRKEHPFCLLYKVKNLPPPPTFKFYACPEGVQIYLRGLESRHGCQP